MILLLLFAFVAGVVTVLSPCILPVLPIILSSSVEGGLSGRARPFGVVIGFVSSFTLLTLFLSTLVTFVGISAEALRAFAVLVIGIFGVSLLVPRLQILLEGLFSRLTRFAPQSSQQSGFFPGLLIGLSLGLVWTPCVGPILASVISLALTGNVSLAAFFITLSYAVGTAVPMLLIMIGGRELLRRVPWLMRNTGNIQRGFGFVMICVALAIYTNLDRRFQTFIVDTFPRYGSGLVRLEDRSSVHGALDQLQEKSSGQQEGTGKPLFDVLNSKGIQAPELISGGIWINSEPLTLSSLRGKVVLIDFWTYSCINCQRTLPYLKKWHEKYASKGLVIIGVHAPEFEFEKNAENVRKAVHDFGIEYPVVQDNDFATWRAYSNRYWPAKYFVDKDGYIRSTHFGEGSYDESERIIQELLGETGVQGISRSVENPEYSIYSRTPETYLGYGRMENFASRERIEPNRPFYYTAPRNLPENSVAYSGEWSIAEEYASPRAGSALELNFESKEAYLVMRPRAGKAQVRVLVDSVEQFPGDDVSHGFVTVDSDRLYKLVKLPEPGRHVLRLEFSGDAVDVYAFTFG